MIEEKLIISDTNIFIDLISINVLDKLFLLPCDICTTDFVLNEIKWPNQRAEIDKHIITKDIEEVSFGFDELVKISELHSNSSTSMTDCSVWYLAKKTEGRLLTGDGKLKKAAEGDNVKVSGILYIFDNLVEYDIVNKASAAVLQEQLMAINSRLPKAECEKRIKEWAE